MALSQNNEDKLISALVEFLSALTVLVKKATDELAKDRK